MGTFRNQLCDAKADQGDVLSLKMGLIKNVFRPDRKFVSPMMGKIKFVRNWFDIYEWLCYSPLKEGVFFLWVLFTDDLYSKKSQSQRSFTIAFQPTSDSKRRSEKHFNDRPPSSHTKCIELYCACNQNYITKVSVPIDIQTSVLAKSKIAKYENAVEKIIDIVIYHGRQGIPFRGHRDDYKYYPQVRESSYDNNPGNFVETLNLVVRHGDKVVEDHLKTAPLNARYTSAPVQNHFIFLCTKYITDKIVDEIKAAKFFTILADGVIDVSGKEQLALVYLM